MRGVSVEKPWRSFWICVAITLVGAGLMAWGGLSGGFEGQDASLPGGAVAVGLLVVVMGPLLALNFYRGVGAIASLRAGKGVIAQWTVNADDLAAFLRHDAERSARGPLFENWCAPSGVTNAGGVRVAFSDEALLFGDTYFGLPARGIVQFLGVQIYDASPAVVEFSVQLSSFRPTASAFAVDRNLGCVRVPIAPEARDAAELVRRHYASVLDGSIAVNPRRWRRGRRIGLGIAAFGAVSGALGLAFWEKTPFALSSDAHANLVVTLTVAGIMVTSGGLGLTALAWFMDPLRDKRF